MYGVKECGVLTDEEKQKLEDELPFSMVLKAESCMMRK